eukprot:10550240-Lingulodinium_polyedra.AAC.1
MDYSPLIGNSGIGILSCCCADLCSCYAAVLMCYSCAAAVLRSCCCCVAGLMCCCIDVVAIVPLLQFATDAAAGAFLHVSARYVHTTVAAVGIA